MAEVEDDESRKRIVRAAALVVGQWLQESCLLEKKVWQLQLPELEGLTNAAVSAFIVAESREKERRDAEPVPTLRDTLA